MKQSLKFEEKVVEDLEAERLRKKYCLKLFPLVTKGVNCLLGFVQFVPVQKRLLRIVRDFRGALSEFGKECLLDAGVYTLLETFGAYPIHY